MIGLTIFIKVSAKRFTWNCKIMASDETCYRLKIEEKLPDQLDTRESAKK